MKRRAIFFVLSLMIIVSFLYGCCSSSKGGFFINPNGDSVIDSKGVTIDELGRLPTVNFSSGAKFEGLKNDTMTPKIAVTIVEQKMGQQNTAYLNSFEKDGVSLYKISAVQNPTNLIAQKTNVTTIEKPVNVTLPTNSKKGLCYLGIRESDTDPWRFCRVGAQNDAEINNMNASSVVPKMCSFNLHRLETTFGLVVYNGDNVKNLPETVVNSVIASTTNPSILVKNGKYLNDLGIKGILRGIKIDSINPTDFRTRITYRNNSADEAAIDVNGIKVNQTTKVDQTVPGYTYYHTFVVDSVLDHSLMSSYGEYSFLLNIEGLETDSFPPGFLIEFYNKVDGTNILPYYYSEFFTINTTESVTLTLSSGEGNVPDTTNGFYRLNPTFNITSNHDFSDEDKEKIENAISVSNIDSEKIRKIWNGKTLNLGFEELLLPDTEYTISMGDVSGLDGVVLTKFKDLTFTTQSEDLIEVFNITYKLNGGNAAFGNPLTYREDSETFTLVNPTKSGFTFIGWTGSNGDEPQMVVTIEKGSRGNRNYSANYSVVDFTISYNLGEDDVINNNPTGYNAASETFALVDPIRVGYTFTGWTSADIDIPTRNVTIPQGSIGERVYTANWSINSYMLVLDMGTGIASVDSEGLHEYNTNITASCTMLDGYEFDSWTGDYATGTFKMPAGNVCMKANGKPIVYPIVYNLNGGNDILNLTEYDLTSGLITLNNPTKDGFSFIGWEGTGIPSGTASLTVTIPQGSKGARTYTASYTPIFTITYNLAGGEAVAVNPATYTAYSEDITLNKPTRGENYTFVGWTESIATFPKMLVKIPHGSSGNRTFTANWVETITFILPGGVPLVLNKCPGGRYMMGSPNDEPGSQNNEKPQHEVEINGFYMGVFEVTQEQYYAVMNTNPSYFTGDLTRPVDSVNAIEAKAFCASLSSYLYDNNYIDGLYIFDLPSEAQWEYACRAGTSSSLNNNTSIENLVGEDNNATDVGWYSNISDAQTHPVGQKTANAWGLYDMHGNVKEWCRNYYLETFHQYCIDNNLVDEPSYWVGTEAPVRGGSYKDEPENIRSGYREGLAKSSSNGYLGFRVVYYLDR